MGNETRDTKILSLVETLDPNFVKEVKSLGFEVVCEYLEFSDDEEQKENAPIVIAISLIWKTGFFEMNQTFVTIRTLNNDYAIATSIHYIIRDEYKKGMKTMMQTYNSLFIKKTAD